MCLNLIFKEGIIMKNTHLSLDDRKIIQSGLENNLTRVEIAKLIGKSPSTVGKEIKLRRILKPRNVFNTDSICIHLKECGGCFKKCERYEECSCSRRDRLGVCNLCNQMNNCKLDKYFYRANKANEAYLFTLSDSRQGFNLTSSEMISIANTIKPLLKRGQSVYQIIHNHSELNICPKTLYTYIESGLFKEYGIDNFSLKKQVSRKSRKNTLKKRKEPVNYTGRKYEDYINFLNENPTLQTTEMDTVYNNPNGPYIQTFIFQNTGLMIGFLHQQKTSESMSGTLDYLQNILDDSEFKKLFSVLLTDRGTEFEKSKLFEINMDTGEFRSKIFYCNPQTPSQKPHVENNHNFVRYVLPNKTKLNSLSQSDIELMFSHINSVPRASLGGKTPYEVFSFFYGKDILRKLNIQKIEKDMVTLQPYLLKIK